MENTGLTSSINYFQVSWYSVVIAFPFCKWNKWSVETINVPEISELNKNQKSCMSTFKALTILVVSSYILNRRHWIIIPKLSVPPPFHISIKRSSPTQSFKPEKWPRSFSLLYFHNWVLKQKKSPILPNICLFYILPSTSCHCQIWGYSFFFPNYINNLPLGLSLISSTYTMHSS